MKYNFSDALIKEYLKEGWTVDESGQKFFVTTSPTEFKNFLLTLANTGKAAGRLIIEDIGIDEKITLYIYGDAYNFIHQDLMSAGETWYTGLPASYHTFSKYFNTMETATIGFPTIEEFDSNDFDVQEAIDCYYDDWDLFIHNRISNFMPKDQNNNPDFNSKEAKRIILDFTPGQNKRIILNKYLSLRQEAAIKNGTRVRGNGFGLDISDFTPTTDFWKSRLYTILKDEIKN